MPGQSPDMLYYDGHCGLCHGAVKFVLKHDRAGTAFRFAPLDGATFESRVPAGRRAGLGDSIVVQTVAGALLTRSDAVVHILRRLGAGWKVLGAVLAVVPRPVRNLAYDFVARVRYRVFGKRDDVCPVVPGGLRGRFER